MIFYHVIILFVLAKGAYSRSLETSSTEKHNSEELLKAESHGRGPLRPLSAFVEGGTISGMAVADNGDD
jgi:hypothetical protein